jgi:hypothetical protein
MSEIFDGDRMRFVDAHRTYSGIWEQVPSLKSECGHDRIHCAASMTMKQHPPIFSLRNRKAVVVILMCRAQSGPASSAFLDTLESGKQLLKR